ncbi:MAG: hypothetical protein IPN86_10475 [Saprospiraceae bacterium]|nr:hypothetical protein [Saprospiraceae bacterium]
MNITETCDDDNLNLITKCQCKVVSTADTDFLKTDIESTQNNSHRQNRSSTRRRCLP